MGGGDVLGGHATLLNTVTSSAISGRVPSSSSRNEVSGASGLDQVTGLFGRRREVVHHHIGPLQQVGGSSAISGV